MIAGINYPWAVYDGRANYGCDFGRNKWESHTGVTAHAHEGGGIRWTAGGDVDGLDAEFFKDMDAAIEIAASAGVGLCLVLLDYLWFDDPQRRMALLDRHGRSAFLDRVIDPFLDRYGTAGAIHSFDLINEPDWIVSELATDPSRAVWPLDRLRAFAGMMSARIRARSRARITLGGGRVASVREWDHPAYGLDVLQLHSYPDVRYPNRDDSVFGRTAASFGLSKPLLIGECPSHPRLHPPGHLPPSYTVEDYLTLARDGGYLGAWPWSFKGVDTFGAVDLRALG